MATTTTAAETVGQAFRRLRRDGLAGVSAEVLADPELLAQRLVDAERRLACSQELRVGDIVALYYSERRRAIEARYQAELGALLATDLAGEAYRAAERPIARRRSDAHYRLRRDVGLVGTNAKGSV